MKQSKCTGKITARYLLLIFLQILRQLHCKWYMVTQLTNTQKSFFAPRLRGSIRQQKRNIHYWILTLRLFFYSPKPRTQVWILKTLTYSGRKHRLQLGRCARYWPYHGTAEFTISSTEPLGFKATWPKETTGSGGENAEFTSGVCFIAEFLSVSPHSKDASCNL